MSNECQSSKLKNYEILAFGLNLAFDAVVQSQTLASDELWHLTFQLFGFGIMP
jgi:hypothetical protein